MVVDVSIANKVLKFHRVVAVVDCGTVVSPDIVMQQAVGATYFGLSAALTGKITIDQGKVMQHNFYDYTVLRTAAAPAVDVHWFRARKNRPGWAKSARRRSRRLSATQSSL